MVTHSRTQLVSVFSQEQAFIRIWSVPSRITMGSWLLSRQHMCTQIFFLSGSVPWISFLHFGLQNNPHFLCKSLEIFTYCTTYFQPRANLVLCLKFWAPVHSVKAPRSLSSVDLGCLVQGELEGTWETTVLMAMGCLSSTVVQITWLFIGSAKIVFL